MISDFLFFSEDKRVGGANTRVSYDNYRLLLATDTTC